MSTSENTARTTDAEEPSFAGATRRVRRTSLARTIALVVGIALIVAALGVAAWELWPDAAFVAGFIRPSVPYPTRFPSNEVGAIGVLTPKGDRLVIPRIAVDILVTGGTDATEALRIGGYHVAGTPEPGSGGNMCIAGHRIRSVFTLLYRVRPGDPVILYWHGAEHDYRVSRVFDVPATGTEILQQRGPERLTLYTCLPRFLGNRRTVVVAEPQRQ